MACKLKCPNCNTVLKEEGDEMKESGGEYRVYENACNSLRDAGDMSLILCLECEYTDEAYMFSE